MPSRQRCHGDRVRLKKQLSKQRVHKNKTLELRLHLDIAYLSIDIATEYYGASLNCITAIRLFLARIKKLANIYFGC